MRTAHEVSVDGRHLAYPGTGLAVATAEIIRSFRDLGWGPSLTVLAPEEMSLSALPVDLDDIRFRTLRTRPAVRRPLQLLGRTIGVPDHVDRMVWAGAARRELASFHPGTRHFIPYLFNYGDVRSNVVVIPDLVYRTHPDDWLTANRPWWWNLRHRIPLRPTLRRREEVHAGLAREVVVYSEHVRDCVLRSLGVPPERISVIPLAAPRWVTERHVPARDGEVRSRYGLPARFVLYVGGYARRKNVAMLLRACAQAATQDGSFRCAFVGLQGPLDSRFLPPETLEALEDPEVRRACLVLPSVPYAELASLYRLCELTVYPSLAEGFGLPVLEAAAAGRLCLCGDHASLAEVQAQRDLRIDSHDADAWASGMLRFWRDTALLRETSGRSSSLIDRFSWDVSARMLWDLLQS